MGRTCCLLGRIVVSFSFFWGFVANAQLIPDASLGLESSTVNQVSAIRQQIEGGALRGQNLFHSFQEFNVAPQTEVYFANPVAVENILTRVTGGHISQIFGTLGVNGDANLFLINPNGIYFGKDAHLDLRGSFTASTANGIQLGESGWFGAIASERDQLLNIRPETRFDYALQQYSGNITNEGQLQAGKDLNLQAQNLFLSGQLGAQTNLNLQATDTVKIRDFVDNPLKLIAGQNLLIEGLDTIDIFALNHPDSGLFSGENMVFRSNNTVGGDAHYWSGGLFKVERLDGSLGNLFSPVDPIIRASGDVIFDSYNGASLHIFAGGNVNISGNITITGTDTTANSIIQNFILADGKTIAINGNAQPTLDIRAGTTAFGSTGITGDISGFSAIPNTTGIVSSADINIGSITNNGGVVFLTNQYSPNTSLTGGAITVGTIDTSTNNPNDAGAVTINARSKIILIGDINANSSSSFGNANNGGNITLSTTGGSISTKSLFTSSIASSGNTGNGGNILITAVDNITTEDLESDAYSFSSGNAGNGGNIVLSTTKGNIFAGTAIDTGHINSGSISLEGSAKNAGDIAFSTTQGSITAGIFYSYSFASFNAGNAGNIDLKTTGGSITTQDLSSMSYSASGIFGDTENGGAITLSTTGGDISIGNVNSYSNTSSNSVGNAKNGGAIALSTTGGNIITGFLNAYSASNGNVGNGGAIALSTTGGNIATGSLISYSYSSNSGNVGDGGAITFSTTKGNISSAEYIDSSSFSTFGSAGNGGAITFFTTEGNISSTGDYINSASASNFGNVGNGGAITFSTNVGNISIPDLYSYSYSNFGMAGNGGAIALSTGIGNISTQDLYSASISTGNISGMGGNISVKAQNGDILGIDSPVLGSFSTLVGSNTGNAGAGGKVTLTAKNNISNLEILTLSSNSQSGAVQVEGSENLALTNTNIITSKQVTLKGPYSELFTLEIGGVGQSGNVTISSYGNLIFNNSSIQSDTKGTDFAGNVNIISPKLITFNDSYIQSDTSNLGQAGSINISAGDGLKLENQSYLSAITSSQGNAGKLLVQPYPNNPNLNIQLSEGSKISASTSSSGNGGNLIVTAPNNIKISGQGTLAVETSSSGDAGAIAITSKNLTLSDGVTISASTSGSGNGGSIKFNVANNINIFDSSVKAITEIGSTGNGGNISIDPNDVILKNSNISVESKGTGRGGDINIIASGNLKLNNSALNTETFSSDGGNINIRIGKIIDLSKGSNITATAGRSTLQGNGGNIDIVTAAIRATLNQDNNIRAEAFLGNGGSINITSPFPNTPVFLSNIKYTGTDIKVRNDITVSSTFGYDGEFNILEGNSPKQIKLESFSDADSLLGQNACAVKNNKIANGSSFVLKGKGGLPDNPKDLATRTAMVDFMGDPNNVQSINPSPTSQSNKIFNDSEINIAQGWQHLPDGRIQLTGRSPIDSLRGAPQPQAIQPIFRPPSCI